MEISQKIIDSIVNYPKSSLLFLVAILNLIWVFYVIIAKKGFKQKIYKAYFLYAFFSIIWVISNAYFQSQFLVEWGADFAKFMALLANISASSSIIGFYYISCAVKDSKISTSAWILMTFLWIETILFNIIPGLTVKEVLIFDDHTFQLVQGPWTGLFFLIGVIVIGLSFANFILAIRRNKVKIENVRVFYILFGMTLLYASIVIFLVILPFYFQNYKWAWVPPFMSLADVLIVGYAIVTQRFIDIRMLISRFFKAIIAFFVAVFLIFPPLMSLARVFQDVNLRYWEIFGIALIILIYNKLMTLLNSRGFYRYFGGPEAEHLKYITNELRKKTVVYTSVPDFEKDLQNSFRKKLRNITPQIILVDMVFKKAYPKLMQYYEKNSNTLVTEELRFSEKNQNRMIPFLNELESLGGICIPLFNPSKGLIGLMSMGQKKYNHMYSKEEIAVLESLGSLVSVTVNNILYSSELQAEVARKTKQLKKKIEEINELVEQQSDFIAVTAHEFRTPLSIASFQIEEIIQSSENVDSNEKIEELKVVETSLENLKQLTEKLFAVQQYDLNKVSLNREEVDLKSFLRKVYDDFVPIMKVKKLQFKFESSLNNPLYASIDTIQMRQVMHNLLRNAYKFTPEKGQITLKLFSANQNALINVEDSGPGIPNSLKKSVFEKFRTKSSGAGIGLGLYLCKKVINLHKGKIWVDDAEKGGASFHIQLQILSK